MVDKLAFEWRKSIGSTHFAFLGSGFAQNFGQVVCMRENTLGISKLAASKHVKEKTSYFRLTCVAQKRLCISSVIASVHT